MSGLFVFGDPEFNRIRDAMECGNDVFITASVWRTLIQFCFCVQVAYVFSSIFGILSSVWEENEPFNHFCPEILATVKKA